MAATLTSKASSLLQANSDEGYWPIGNWLWVVALEVAITNTPSPLGLGDN